MQKDAGIYMRELTSSEIKEEKRRLEAVVGELVKAFQERTGVAVQRIGVACTTYKENVAHPVMYVETKL